MSPGGPSSDANASSNDAVIPAPLCCSRLRPTLGAGDDGAELVALPAGPDNASATPDYQSYSAWPAGVLQSSATGVLQS